MCIRDRANSVARLVFKSISSDKTKVKHFLKSINFLHLSKIELIKRGLLGSNCLEGKYNEIIFSSKLLLKLMTKSIFKLHFLRYIWKKLSFLKADKKTNLLFETNSLIWESSSIGCKYKFQSKFLSFNFTQHAQPWDNALLTLKNLSEKKELSWKKFEKKLISFSSKIISVSYTHLRAHET